MPRRLKTYSCISSRLQPKTSASSCSSLQLRSYSYATQTSVLSFAMAQRWESDLDEDLQDVDLNLAIGTYGQNGTYEDGTAHLCNCLLRNANKYTAALSSAADRRGQHLGRAADGSTSRVLSSPRCCQTRKKQLVYTRMYMTDELVFGF